jgi:NAD(P)-dependent dehydrogenase (short-subunit alcohol dehydrogenase family)
MSGILRGQHAVVTGGGRGIGAAIAEALAADGADLTLMGRTRSTLQARADAIGGAGGGRAQAVVCDVSVAAEVARAFAEAVAALGPVRILINNAGVSDVAALGDISLPSWERTLAVNLTGTLLCMQQVLPAMLAGGAGRVVNVASTAGLKGYARVAAYCASKHGVLGLTRAAAAEVARAGVTVNAVCPGYVGDTGMHRAAVENVKRLTGKSDDEARAIILKASPRGSLVTLEEVAATVRWLCSPGASAITGQAIAVAAGEVMR